LSNEYAQKLWGHFSSPAVVAVIMLLVINFGWAVVNLVPIPPLDGGRVLMEWIGHHPHGGDDYRPWEVDADWWKRG
jgi:membrane-associated protease RseP (regulator of RpoE activity)